MADVVCVIGGSESVGPLEPVWATYGYDEINWTSTPRGRRNTATLRSIAGRPMVVRAHNLLTSGNGRGLPHWSSGNVYHEDEAGRAVYDWSHADAIFDTWVENGMVPLVELGFCPAPLVRPSERVFHPMPSLYGEYESWGWSSVPSDEGRWAGLIGAIAAHVVERYGSDEVSGWWWELWNEPDISYWDGTPEQYFRLYDVTVAALRDVLPEAKVGGPSTTGSGTEFLAGFLDHCLEHGTPLDFVSFHTKGAPDFPRTYGVLGSDGAEGGPPQSPSTAKMLGEIETSLTIVRSHPELAGIPVFVDECDPGVPAHIGVFDNRNYGFRNTEYYAVFQLQLMAALAGPREDGVQGVALATAWTWYFEGDRWFEGTRSFFTAEDVPAPVTAAYRMLSLLGDDRLAAALISRGDHPGVGVLPSRRSDGSVAAIVWHHDDDQYAHRSVEVEVRLEGLALRGPVRVRAYAVDADHSNSHTVWKALGSPQDPTPEQIATIKRRATLELVTEEYVKDFSGELVRSVSLSCPAAVLIEVSPA